MTLKTRPIRINLSSPDAQLSAGIGVSASLTVYEVDGGIVVPSMVYGSTDATGSALLHLWPNSRGVAGSQYRIVAQRAGALLLNVLITVPDGDAAVEIPVESIINQAPYPVVSAAQQAVTDAQARVDLATAQAVIAAAQALAASGSASSALANKNATDGNAAAALANKNASDTDVGLTHADVVATHADVTSATAQALTSTTKAGEAAISAGAASGSANAAAGSASALDAALASFRSKYLGSFTTDPALDGNGAALVAGAEYFNTTSSKLRVYSGSTWSDYDAAAQLEVISATLSAAQAAASAAAAGISATGALGSAGSAVLQAAAAAASKIASDAVLVLAQAAAAAAQTYASTAQATNPDSPIRLNPRSITANFAVGSNYNAASVGPIAISPGITVTVGDNATWSIH